MLPTLLTADEVVALGVDLDLLTAVGTYYSEDNGTTGYRMNGIDLYSSADVLSYV